MVILAHHPHQSVLSSLGVLVIFDLDHVNVPTSLIRQRVVADIRSRLLCYDNLVVDQSLNLVLQRAAFVNGVTFHVGMVRTSLIRVDPLGRIFWSYGRDRGDVTSSFKFLIQLVNWLSDGCILFERSAVKIWSGSRKILASGR